MIDPRREWSRREFLASTALALGWTALGGGVWANGQPPVMPVRPLGKTGLQVSLLGLGAYPVGSLADEDKAIGVVHRLLDVGVNYLDTAPSYSNGTSELRVGKAIRGKRDRVILATKTLPRGRKAAMKDLEASLVRLGTDHVDLWQIHSIRNHKDVDALFDDNGSVRAGEDAIKAGKVRFLGVTGHTNPELHLRVIKEYDFATMLMPLNPADPHFVSFEEKVLPAAVEKKMGVIAMKVLAAGRLPKQKTILVGECIRYAASLPISCAIVGLKTLVEVEAAASAVLPFRPIADEERLKFLALTEDHPGKSLEWYKREKITPRSSKPRRSF